MNKKATHIVPYNFSGNKGESIFWDIYMDLELLKTIIPQVQGEFESISAEYDQINDDRSLAIVGAMLIEYKVDEFLLVSIPKYKDLADNKDFTFSLKIQLAKALKIIPSKVFNAIDPIRKIRNGFAHHLKIKTFEDYIKSENESHNSEFNNVANKLNTFGDIAGKIPKDNFKLLVNTIVYALFSYTEQLKVYRSRVTSQEFVDEIFNNARTMSEQHSALKVKPMAISELITKQNKLNE